MSESKLDLPRWVCRKPVLRGATRGQRGLARVPVALYGEVLVGGAHPWERDRRPPVCTSAALSAD
jgi:hypothetical protein